MPKELKSKKEQRAREQIVLFYEKQIRCLFDPSDPG
jgi:hypothetical protein